MARRRPTEPTVNPARGAALVVVAVLVGLLLLRNGLDTSEVVTSTRDDSAGEDTSEDTTDDTSEEETPDETEDTTPARTPPEVTVIVLNGSTVNGAAGRYTTAVASAGYQTLEAGDAPTKVPATQVLFAEGYDREAAAVALAIGAPATVTPAPIPTPPPGEIGAANVVVVLGADLASTTPTTAAPAADATTETTTG